MEQGNAALLADRGIHGFNTLADLDIGKLTEDALKRWLRPNEVHAILSNYVHFEVQPQPVNLPPSGSLLLFDRKMLRNFRKDGHRWKKKKDGKTIQEAHEKLKIGTEERIHVYYARNEDDPNFYRRCYWLLDRNLERIVLVHYRQTSEENAMQLLSMPVEPKEVFPPTDSPLRSLNSTTGSNNSELMGSVVYHEEINSCEDHAIYSGSQVSPSPNTRFNECGASTLDELERLAWKDILEKPNSIELTKTGNILSSSTQMGYQLDSRYNDNFFGRVPCSGHSNLLSDSSYPGSVKQLDSGHLQLIDGGSHMPDASPKPVQSSIQDTVFSIVDVSPSYANTSVETKIIVVGHFSESQKHLAESNMFCVLGGQCVPAEPLQTGVYRIIALPHMPGFVDLYLSLDGHTPISQAINFEYYSAVSSPSSSRVASPEVNSEEPMHIEFLTRLVHLLFSTSNIISIISDGMSENSLREANQFASLTSTSLENNWLQFLSLDNNDESSSSTNLQHLFKLVLKNQLQEWLLLRVAEGCKTTVHDIKGLGVIHLCAILDYAWSVPLFSMSSLSLDFRDACGWTALHWSAYYGREKTVAALLSAGANPSLVTDPSSDFPGGRTAADLASEQGHEGLGAYLAERGLKAHFRAMTLSGNAPPPSSSTDTMNQEHGQPENFTEQELCLKDSLAAYRNAADAADRIQTAFRERSHTLQIKAARLSNTSNEATSIVAALKIQNAFRSYNRRKVMRAAVRIQGTFRTWQARNNFLKMRQHALKIQAVFRGHQVRKQYLKVVWSVGVLEKVVLRWRLKRKGLRGLKAEISKSSPFVEEENCVEEDFYRISREQAEERIRRSVVRVQAMFRSYRAQQEYRRMKLAFNQAKLECNDFFCSSRQF